MKSNKQNYRIKPICSINSDTIHWNKELLKKLKTIKF